MSKKILRIDDYPNQLDLFKLSSTDIESQIKSYALEFSQIRNQEVEWKMKFPIFLTSFYTYIYNKQTIPTQEEFWNAYLIVNKAWFSEYYLDKNKQEALRARVFRTYPSLIRDLHFSKLASERLRDCAVSYNTRLDVEQGIDLVIHQKNMLYGFNLFTQTKRAFQGRNKKVNRHDAFGNVSYHDIPVDFAECKKVGNFFLYGLTEIDIVKSILGHN